MTHRKRFVSATVAAVLTMTAGAELSAALPAGAVAARQAVDGLVQVRSEMGVDTFSMSGTYTTSSRLGHGTMEANSAG